MSNPTRIANDRDWLMLSGNQSRIARTPVTNRQWKQFIQESGYVPKKREHDGDYLYHWQSGEPLNEDLDKPVVWVSHHNAVAYCDFYGYRLPTLKELQTLDGRGVREWYGDRHPLSFRGDFFLFNAWDVRCASRCFRPPQGCYGFIGFRPAHDIGYQQASPIHPERRRYKWK